MPTGSFDLSGGQVSLSAPVQPPSVFRFDTTAEKPFTWLPNVVCVSVAERVGPAPPVASFRYLQDNAYANTLGWPSRIDDVWPLDAQGPYVVRPDDRIVCALENPDGSSLYLFDGFAQIPQADVGPNSEQATFTAVGVAAREFDNVVNGRIMRNSDPEGIRDRSGDSDISTDLIVRFNPSDNTPGDDGGYRPNKTPDFFDTEDPPGDEGSSGPTFDHPVFAQEGIQGRRDTKSPAYWSISDAIKYLLATNNRGQKYTGYPDLSTLDDLLEVAHIEGDAGPLTAGDILTDPLLIRDYDASNKPWPEAVAELLGYAGFVMRWDLESGEDGNPLTMMRIYRRDMLSRSPLKWLYLDEPGSSLAQGSRNNVSQLHLARDDNGIVNAWQVETNQRQVEISVVLAPLYQPKPGDQTPTTDITSGLKQFFRSNFEKNNATAEVRRKYRWYGVDELGDGYWKPTEGLGNGGSWFSPDDNSGSPFNFRSIFPPDDDGTPSYAVRYRPAIGRHLAATDSLGRPRNARLDISFDALALDQTVPGFPFASSAPTWHEIKDGWHLLPDRLGIEVTAENPDQWSTGNKKIPGGGDIRGVTWWAATPDGSPCNKNEPLLRLTCVIEDDLRMPISIGKRIGSPTKFARWRVADARDHFQHTSIDLSSANYKQAGGDGTDPYVVRDDTKAAENHARALQRAHEMPALAGSVTIPGSAFSYEIGDRVSYIAGRAIRLYANAGQSQGELTTYPTVVSRTLTFDPNVYTELHLSDLRADRAASNSF